MYKRKVGMDETSVHARKVAIVLASGGKKISKILGRVGAK